MATTINLTVPAIAVVNTDVEFVVKKDGAVLGKLKISRGGLDWYPKNAKKPQKASWTHFNRYMAGEFS